MSSAAALARAAAPDASMQTIESDLLGSLNVPPDELIHFPVGLFGFPDCRRFVLLPAQRQGLFWLQSADHSALAFLLADPFRFFDGYEIELGAAERAELEVRDAADVALLAIVTLPRTRDELPTANLQGPLAFNLRARRAIQLALPDSAWGVRCPLDLAGSAA